VGRLIVQGCQVRGFFDDKWRDLRFHGVEFFELEGFRRAGYLRSPWPSINAGANPLAVGSHVIPDPARPVCIRSRCPILIEFLTQLAAIAPAKSVA